jgi:SNF2 family DNA or RNA helicase
LNKIIKSNLYSHQKENLQFHLKHDASADWSEPGIGKSLIALSKVVILNDLNLVRKTLIICPKTVMFTWDIEIKKHTNLTHTMLIGSLKDKIQKLKDKSDIFTITYDSIPGRESTYGILLRELAKKKFDFLIADEATLIKNRSAIRTKALILLGDLIPRKLFLSGTPITNDPTSIFNIYRALDGGKTFGRNFFAARNKYFKNIGSYFPSWVAKDLMMEELSNKIYSVAIRQTKDNCLDLPEKVWSSRYMEVSPEQRNYYIPIAEDIIKNLNTRTGRVRIKTALDKIGKLSQILSGFLYTESGTSYLFNPNPKLELLEDVIEEFPIGEKIIIYCRWVEEIELLSRWCRERGYSYVALSGSTENRAELIDRFQNGDAKLFICNIAVGKYSLTLTSSATIIYYSMGFGIEDFIQSSDRIHRISQTKTCLYIPLLTRNGIDESIYNTVNRKLKVAQAITDPEFKERLTKI